MKRKMLVSGLAVMLTLGISFEAMAQEESVEEELLFMEIPVVFASSKRLQPITETASSVEVITAEEVERSGALSLADVLRKFAGVQIKEPSASSHAVGVRGFADAQHVLITVDGSSAYLHHVNHTYLDLIPVDLEEIERIEIVKGPGGVFYGGSAFSGVVNVVTKTPKQMEGTHINLVGGNWDIIRGNMIHGGSYKNWDYSFSAGYHGTKYLSPSRAPFMHESTHTHYGSGRLIYHLGGESSISVDIRHRYSDDGITRHCTGIKNTYVTLRYDQPNFWARLFHNKQFKYALNESVNVDDTNHEFEIMRILKWGKNITSISGFAKRVDFTCKNSIGDKQKNHIKDYAMKAENEYHATDQFIFTLGGRGEYFSEVEWVGLGRGSIIYKPTVNQRFALTIANGYYLPSLAQLYGWGKVLPFPFNPDLTEERITSYELAHYGTSLKKIRSNIAIFYNDYQGLIPNKSDVTPINEVDGYKRGLEAGFDFLLTDWLTSFLNYTYQTIHRSDFSDLEVDPENMFNFGMQTKFDKWSTNLSFSYVDRFYEIYDAANPVLGLLTPPQEVNAYTTVDARIAYTPKNNFEIALAVSNLFNDIHYESNPVGWIGGDEVSRRITASMSCKF